MRCQIILSARLMALPVNMGLVEIQRQAKAA